MTTKTLHFTVDPSILNLPRQMFWYEDKQEKALNIMDSLVNGQATPEQIRMLLDGDAYFITEDAGKTLTMITEIDKEWKKEVEERKEYLKKRKEKASLEESDRERYTKEVQRKILKETDELDDEDEETEALEREQRILDHQDNVLERMTKNANEEIAKRAFIMGFTSKDKGEKEACETLVKEFTSKQFDFVFKGHEYTYKHSARNQSRCPHCDQQSGDGFIWDPKRDKDAYIGTYKQNDIINAICFECPKCFKKFFYHNTNHGEEDK